MWNLGILGQKKHKKNKELKGWILVMKSHYGFILFKKCTNRRNILPPKVADWYILRLSNFFLIKYLETNRRILKQEGNTWLTS